MTGPEVGRPVSGTELWLTNRTLCSEIAEGTRVWVSRYGCQWWLNIGKHGRIKAPREPRHRKALNIHQFWFLEISTMPPPWMLHKKFPMFLSTWQERSHYVCNQTLFLTKELNWFRFPFSSLLYLSSPSFYILITCSCGDFLLLLLLKTNCPREGELADFSSGWLC